MPRVWPGLNETVLNEATGLPFPSTGYDVPGFTPYIQHALDYGRLVLANPASPPPELAIVYGLGIRNVRSFGAVGNGLVDDYVPIQAAIDSATNYGCFVYFPPGLYNTSQTLKFGPDYNGVEGITLCGPNSTCGPQNCASELRYTGPDAPTTGALVHFSGAYNSIRSLKLSAQASLSTMVKVDEHVSPNTVFTSHPRFEGVTFRSGKPASNNEPCVASCVSIGMYASTDGNKENCIFIDCIFDRASDISIIVGYRCQAYNSECTRCVFVGAGVVGNHGPRGVGLYNNSPSTQWQFNRCDFQSMEVAILDQNYGWFSIDGGESEACKRLLWCHAPATGLPTPALIQRHRFDPSAIDRASVGPIVIPATDHRFISIEDGRPLHLKANVSAQGGGRPLQVYFSKQTCLVAESNSWPNASPFVPDERLVPGRTGGMFVTGDVYEGGVLNPSGGSATQFPTYTGGLNPSATVTISGSATSASVTLPQSEFDTSYSIRLDVESSSGGTVGSLWPSAKSATGFTINTSVAPGSGQTLTVRYTLSR